jgi:hypothetical protein
MMRMLTGFLLSLMLAMTSLSLATARGTNPDIGMDMVICTGVGITTITLGPDGEPVEKSVLCPDSVSLFAADFTLPAMATPEARLIAEVDVAASGSVAAQQELSPSARGPPARI